MDLYILIANILTITAFFIHAFIGDKELKQIEPMYENDEKNKKREIWTMARCGWHWVSFDLFLASIGLALINFSNFFDNEKTLLQILSVYFSGYALVFLFTIFISKKFSKNYLKLGQWILLLIICGLIFMGIN